MVRSTETESDKPPALAWHRVGNLWEKPRGPVYKTLTRLALGGDYVDYRRTKISLKRTWYWPRLEAPDDPDNEVSPALPRTWRYAACLSMDSGVVEKYGDEDVKHAVVRVTRGGAVIAGPLDGEFGKHSLPGEDDQRTLLVRVGPMTSIVSMGLLTADGTLHLPHRGELNILSEQIKYSDEKWITWARQTNTPIV